MTPARRVSIALAANVEFAVTPHNKEMVSELFFSEGHGIFRIMLPRGHVRSRVNKSKRACKQE